MHGREILSPSIFAGVWWKPLNVALSHPPGGGTVRSERVERDPPAPSTARSKATSVAKKQVRDRKSGRIEAEADFILDEARKDTGCHARRASGKAEGAWHQRRHRHAVAFLRPAARITFKKTTDMPLSTSRSRNISAHHFALESFTSPSCSIHVAL